MRHFTSEDWADFARGVAPVEQSAAMQKHLDTGCKKCAQSMGLWQSVVEIAARESSYEPSENSVRLVKGYFARYGPQKPVSGLAKIAQLVYDSFRQPLPAGVRTAGTATRQLLFRSVNFLVDISLDYRPGSERISLVGQIVDSSKHRGIAAVPVLLQRGSDSLAETITNEFGEFQLEFDAEKSLQLSFGFKENRTISFLLPLGSEVFQRPPKVPLVPPEQSPR